jgi:hypothetical protein
VLFGQNNYHNFFVESDIVMMKNSLVQSGLVVETEGSTEMLSHMKRTLEQ